MKDILVILDGASEERYVKLSNMSPLEYAYTPTLNKIMKKGIYKRSIFYPSGREPDSLSCILSILGVNEDAIPRNRAYLECLAADINVKEDEAAMRCNIISFKGGILESFNGMGLSKTKMYHVSENVVTANKLKFYHIGDYRNIIVVKKNKNFAELKDIPPHENLGKNMEYILSDIRKIDILNEFITANQFTYNQKNYMFYPWGISEPIELPEFYKLHNKSCSCVCGAQIVKGIAKAMKIDLVSLKCFTGDTDTELKKKAHCVLRELSEHDVVIAHINGTDEVSHRKDIKGKIDFIEKIDRDFLSEIYINADENVKITILSDHQTSCLTGRHEKGYVDVIAGMI